MHISNHSKEAARIETDLACQALKKADRESARVHFYNVVKRLTEHTIDPEGSPLLVSAILELSNLNFILGKGFEDLVTFLKAGLDAAGNIGDRRSKALLKLHLGRVYYFSEERHKAITLFEEGKEEVESLGDDDILIKSAEFLGLYYHIQGLFKKAIGHFERAVNSYESTKGDIPVNPSAPIWLGYCSAYLGEFHRAIGTLDYYRRFATKKGDKPLAATIRAAMGIILLEVKKNKEALLHLNIAVMEAEETRNALALYFARGGIAYYHYTQNDMEACKNYLFLTIQEGLAAGFVRQYASPTFLEMGYYLSKKGYSVYPKLDLNREFLRILAEPNIHLRGVLYRLVAIEKRLLNFPTEEINLDLEKSESYLEKSGAKIELAKTRFEMVRIKLKEKDIKGAKKLAQNTQKSLALYAEEFYPADLKKILSENAGPTDTAKSYSSKDAFVPLLNGIEKLLPTTDIDQLLNLLVQTTASHLNAEKGALFWMNKKKLEPRALYNMTSKEILSEHFRPNLKLVYKAKTNNSPMIINAYSDNSPDYNEKAILCLPFHVKGETKGVLYHDNTYLDDIFHAIDKHHLEQLTVAVGHYIEKALSISRKLRNISPEKIFRTDETNSRDIIGRHQTFTRILNQADNISPTDSTVLILGETGVGKELFARRIHQKSLRNEKSLIIVDPTTIPENLVESELFGHEKGAFTGADRRRIGRLEMAHNGTLFIDEIGEIPKSTQTKLLRAIQEKSFSRLGGSKNIYSDFRLVVATNRDLAEEVARGRFREDLYYRLNVIPITVPPLRERGDDILLLSRHFLNRYTSRYNKQPQELKPEDEKILLSYNWPGNIRELKNVIERGILLSTGSQLELTLEISHQHPEDPFSDKPSLDEVQRRYIRYVLDQTNGKIAGNDGAARILGMKRSSLYNRMSRLKMR